MHIQTAVLYADIVKTSFNAKVNILYFLETLCDTAKRTGCEAYIAMVQRDLRQIVDQVAPAGHQGTANIAQTRHVRHPGICINLATDN